MQGNARPPGELRLQSPHKQFGSLLEPDAQGVDGWRGREAPVHPGVERRHEVVGAELDDVRTHAGEDRGSLHEHASDQRGALHRRAHEVLQQESRHAAAAAILPAELRPQRLDRTRIVCKCERGMRHVDDRQVLALGRLGVGDAGAPGKCRLGSRLRGLRSISHAALRTPRRTCGDRCPIRAPLRAVPRSHRDSMRALRRA